MDFAIILLVTIAACFALRNPVKACPTAFYAVAIAVDVLFVFGSTVGLPRAVWSPLFVLIQKCELSLAMFVVVMFIGCLAKESRACKWLKPIRSELSIIAWFLSLGHMAVYLESYLPRIFGGGAISGNVMGAFALAIVLLVLLIVLGVTSFAFVKKTMRTETWKKVQKLAYPFFGLVYVHLLLMLLPSALHGGLAAQASVAVYSVVFVGYGLCRTGRALLDRQDAGAPARASAPSFSEEPDLVS
ncbi:ferric reductase-like transmembrane domain-containing protein [Adlercreutzia sp. R25]|uniref:ferric reductase-like transmembrane domain-containing protein n=1 Tax=Adlercreutzia shanghongiae TaxID=3111773 RepID=UPI002DB7C69A|nr:ferric reductase-like transmembrane domain-containing protein [Adlercreutzia sp. R25]MEC4273315.1 ferric reductase-like transmembrane domain-containing protein [Adlercreutzia sp. R25]